MNIESPWFAHDANARNHPKLRTLMVAYGAESYGWFWITVEMLRERSDRTLDLSKPYLKLDYASQLHTDVEQALAFVEHASNVCCLFKFEDGMLYCPGLEERLEGMVEARQRRVDRARVAGLASAQKRAQTAIHSNSSATNVNSSSTDVQLSQPVEYSRVEYSTVEESRVEERRGGESPPSADSTPKAVKPRSAKAFSPPTAAESEEYGMSIGIPTFECARWHNNFQASGWVLSNGNKMKDWKASMRTWRDNIPRFGTPRSATPTKTQFEHTMDDFARIEAANRRNTTNGTT